MIKNKKEISTLTKAEMEIMNILWEEAKPMSTHAIIEQYPEPKPAYSTIATFMKILTKKEFVSQDVLLLSPYHQSGIYTQVHEPG